MANPGTVEDNPQYIWTINFNDQNTKIFALAALIIALLCSLLVKLMTSSTSVPVPMPLYR
jgi:hypothetical protein